MYIYLHYTVCIYLCNIYHIPKKSPQNQTGLPSSVRWRSSPAGRLIGPAQATSSRWPWACWARPGTTNKFTAAWRDKLYLLLMVQKSQNNYLTCKNLANDEIFTTISTGERRISSMNSINWCFFHQQYQLVQDFFHSRDPYNCFLLRSTPHPV